MANSFFNIIFAKAYKLAEDILEGVLVVLNSDNEVEICGAGERAHGVMLKDGLEGNSMDIGLIGIFRVKTGAALGLASPIMASDATGRAVAAASGDYTVGRTLDTVTAADRYVPMLFDQGNVPLP